MGDSVLLTGEYKEAVNISGGRIYFKKAGRKADLKIYMAKCQSLMSEWVSSQAKKYKIESSK